MKDLCNENFNTLKKEIEEFTRRLKDLCLWTGRVTTVKVPSYQKQSTGATQSQSKYQLNLSENYKTVLNSNKNTKDLR